MPLKVISTTRGIVIYPRFGSPNVNALCPALVTAITVVGKPMLDSSLDIHRRLSLESWRRPHRIFLLDNIGHEETLPILADLDLLLSTDVFPEEPNQLYLSPRSSPIRTVAQTSLQTQHFIELIDASRASKLCNAPLLCNGLRC